MSKIIFLICISGITCGLFAQNDAIFEATKGEVSFVSEAPLELIEASSDDLHGLLRPDERTFAFTISTKSFKGFNSPLQQEHFYENYIESDKYPQARYSGKFIENIDMNIPGEYSVRTKGKLEIHGVVRDRVIKIDMKILENKIYADAHFLVLLEDYNITIPKMVFQKIAEEIHISVKLEFEAQR